ncbi:MAG: hypothetical protein KIT83_20740 [Bryobacterales bacterium]|nr:hypothetical protein [Bryobacterales bacterium]
MEGEGFNQQPDLQFGTADFERQLGARQVHKCADCATLLGDSYYTVDGRVTCFTCSDKAATDTPRQDLRGLPKAAVYGIGAALLGTVVYLTVLKFTGYEVGLISIAVGWLVGQAMMKGSRGRGGLAYQLLAVLLTYHSIVFSYLIVGIWQYLEDGDSETVAEGPAVAGSDAKMTASSAAPADAGQSTASGGAREGEATSPSTEAPVAVLDDRAILGLEEEAEVPLLIGLAGLYVVTLFFPFYEGLSNILGMAIIAFGLWEAYRRTRLQVPEVAGPFQFGSGDSPNLGESNA